MNVHSFSADLAVVLAVAAVTAILARLAKQPSVLGYLFAGLLVGPYIPLPVFADHARIEAMAEFGVVLVMFAVGLEFRVAKLKEVLPTSGLTALVQVAFLFWCGMSLGRALGWTTVEGIFLGASICISSTMVVSRVFAERPIGADVRSNVLGILVIQDIVAIVLVAAMTAVAAGGGLAPGDLAKTLGKLALVLLGILGVGIFVVPRLIERVAKTKSSELLVVVSVGLCFGIAELAAVLGYSVALGAFVAGMLVAESGRGSKVEHLVAPMRDVFAAIFFVSIGMTVDPLLAWKHLPIALLVFVVVVLGQLISVSVAGVLSGNGLRRSMTAGLAIGQIGEFSFILAAIGIGAKVVRLELQPILVTVAVLTAFTTPLALGFAPQIVEAADRVLPPPIWRMINLYEDWVGRFRANSERREVPKLRRAIRTLILDAIVITLVLGLTTWGHAKAATFLVARADLEPRMAKGAVIGAVLVLLAPIILSGIKNTFKFSHLVADVVLPSEGVDPLAVRVSRHTLRITILLAATLAIGVPTVTVLGPVVGASGALVLSVVVLGLGVYLYRSAHELDHEFESGAETLAALMARQVSDRPEPELSDRSLLPGLDHARTFLITEESHAVNKTLGEVHLRARTGSTVIAIHRGHDGVTLPTGHEPLRPGDKLALIGTSDALGRAELLLKEGPDALTAKDAPLKPLLSEAPPE